MSYKLYIKLKLGVHTIQEKEKEMENHMLWILKRFYEIFLTTYKAGVSVGDPVLRTGKPLSVELGPGKCFSQVQI